MLEYGDVAVQPKVNRNWQFGNVIKPELSKVLNI